MSLRRKSPPTASLCPHRSSMKRATVETMTHFLMQKKTTPCLPSLGCPLLLGQRKLPRLTRHGLWKMGLILRKPVQMESLMTWQYMQMKMRKKQMKARRKRICSQRKKKKKIWKTHRRKQSSKEPGDHDVDLLLSSLKEPFSYPNLDDPLRLATPPCPKAAPCSTEQHPLSTT
ncbi:SH3 domain-binding glutamic acid-rich protein isoform X4 [Thalassophryne amazonica]|uniref:SH3 domain-binding glutamic acid-rich protein isoform X4 n=1 Tax=Thalassophryne amazonica TaxID=390379 RepID=UPI0014714854|nr:SH3 domain-binding glutamic acid-rich protein isoform X4 [Thalassophryne amazonica]